MRIYIGLLLMVLFLSSAEAAIYKIVDKKTNTVSFSDMPSRGAQEVTLPEPQTFSMPALEDDTQEAEGMPVTVEQGETSIAITAPTKEQTFANSNDGKITVSVDIKPKMTADMRVQIFLDGQSVAKPAASNSFQLTEINRGEHTLSAQLLDHANVLIAESEKIIFHMQRVRKLVP